MQMKPDLPPAELTLECAADRKLWSPPYDRVGVSRDSQGRPVLTTTEPVQVHLSEKDATALAAFLMQGVRNKTPV